MRGQLPLRLALCLSLAGLSALPGVARSSDPPKAEKLGRGERPDQPGNPQSIPASRDNPQSGPDILRPPDLELPPYRFTESENALLDQVQRACFLYFWKEVGQPARLAKDRLKAPVSSIAAVGFQLSALPVAVERNWVERPEAEACTRTILRSLIERTDNKRFGLYFHFLDYDTAGWSESGYEKVVSTIDSALLFAGAITAGEYFGGEVKSLADKMIADADWQKFARAPGDFITMGWRPVDLTRPQGDGELLQWVWDQAGDEQRLIYFLAVASDESKSVDPRLYYRMKREVRAHADLPPYVITWGGSLFTYFFSHCWIDYRSLGPDDPGRLGVDAIRVDWFENSRRAVLTHRRRCLDERHRFRTFTDRIWGASACVGQNGYIVPQIGPNLMGKDEWHEGTVAPYAAGSAMMFTPRESLEALIAIRALRDDSGRPLVWRDPSEGGYGFADAFNRDQKYVSDDYVGIDQGPLILAIENARTGLIWRLFMNSDTAKTAIARLRLGEPRGLPPRSHAREE